MARCRVRIEKQLANEERQSSVSEEVEGGSMQRRLPLDCAVSEVDSCHTAVHTHEQSNNLQTLILTSLRQCDVLFGGFGGWSP